MRCFELERILSGTHPAALRMHCQSRRMLRAPTGCGGRDGNVFRLLDAIRTALAGTSYHVREVMLRM